MTKPMEKRDEAEAEADTQEQKPKDDPRFKSFRRIWKVEARPYEPGETLDGITLSVEARDAGSPKQGDMVIRDPDIDGRLHLVAEKEFKAYYEADRA